MNDIPTVGQGSVLQYNDEHLFHSLAIRFEENNVWKHIV